MTIIPTSQQTTDHGLRAISRAAVALLGALIVAGASAPSALAAQPSGLIERVDLWLRADSRARLVVVLVDLTGSVSDEDRVLYAKAAKSIAAAARPADRIVLAPVADRPASRFTPAIDLTLPSGGNALSDEARGRKMRGELDAACERLFANVAARAKGTYLIDAVEASAELFAQGRSAGMQMRLVLLSDMIEEGPVVNLAQRKADAALARGVVSAQRKASTLPDLRGVDVVAAGASGRSAEQMAGIRSFWAAYFQETGAQLQYYGRAIPPAIGR